MAEDLSMLVFQTALGNQRAFEQLYQKTSPQLFGIALAVLRRRELAEEVVQEGYVKAWYAASSYQTERGSVGAWLGTIVRRTAIDRLRRASDENESLPDPDWDAMVSNTPGPLDDLLADADAQRLSTCLDRLDAQQRESLSLAFFHGYTHSELAKKLATPLGTIKAWVRRGLDKLRACIGEVA